jgi:hypothetical protein
MIGPGYMYMRSAIELVSTFAFPRHQCRPRATALIGLNNDYWLEKQSAFQAERWDRVAVVFGMDDAKACNAITRALLAAYQETWRCVAAN